MSRRTPGLPRRGHRPTRRARPTLESLECRCTPAAFSFNNPVIAVNNPMAVASHPASGTDTFDEVEAADDFTVTRQTEIQSATFTGLLPAGTPLSDVTDVKVEVYRVFPEDSNVDRTWGPGTTPPFQTSRVPTRLNSPSDVAFEERDSAAGALALTPTLLAASFTATNSVLTGINPRPNQTTGGEGARTGEEVKFSVTFGTPIGLPEGHYFFVPQVQLAANPVPGFLWLAGVRPNPALSPDLQSWVRGPDIEPDWLRVGTDIVGGATPPTFNAAFSLAGNIDANLAFVQALYNDFLGRNGSRAELAAWVNLLPSLGQAGVASGVLRSPEALTRAVDGLYVQLLGRGAAGGEEQGWVDQLLHGATEEQVIAGIVSGPEFAAHAHALIGGPLPDTNFVQALYELLLTRTDVVNRRGTPEEVNAWLSSLPSLGRAGVAAGFLASAEHRADVIAPLYTTLLDRTTAPSPAEVAGWVNSGLDFLSVELGFASSPEYFANG